MAQLRFLARTLLRLLLRDASSKSLRGFVISGSTSDAKNLSELIGDRRFEIFEDNNAFNPYPKFMIDIFGGLIPDIVLRSSESGQNRIYIEVKLRGD